MQMEKMFETVNQELTVTFFQFSGSNRDTFLFLFTFLFYFILLYTYTYDNICFETSRTYKNACKYLVTHSYEK